MPVPIRIQKRNKILENLVSRHLIIKVHRETRDRAYIKCVDRIDSPLFTARIHTNREGYFWLDKNFIIKAMRVHVLGYFHSGILETRELYQNIS